MKGRIREDSDTFSTRKSNLLSELDMLEEENEPTSISSERPKKKKKEKPEKVKKKMTDEDWENALMNFKVTTEKSKKKSPYDVFDFAYGGKKKRKKKKKKEGEPQDYSAEFDAENTLYTNLLREQSKFTDTLQKKFDAMESVKTSARGVGKFTTDLIASINTARSLSVQIAEKKVNLKKAIAELNMKEKEKFGKGNGDNADLGMMGSSVLQKMINDNAVKTNYGNFDIVDADMDSIYTELSEDFDHTEADAEADAYLKYEDAGVEIHVKINEGKGTREFVGIDKHGNEVPDFPLPLMTELTINYSTGIATDIYSRKYPIIWVE